MYDWPLDKAYLIISSALRGRAKIYYSSLPEAVRIDSNELLVKLKEKYGLASQNVLTRLKGLERVMKPTETVQQFASALAEVFDKLQIKDEAQKVGTFVAGLPAAYKTSIVTMRPSSFEEAEQCALLLEGNVTTNFETTVIAALTSLTQSVEEVKNPTNTVLTARVTPTEKYPENAQQNNARKQPQQREDQTQRQSFPNQPRQSGQRSSPYCVTVVNPIYLVSIPNHKVTAEVSQTTAINIANNQIAKTMVTIPIPIATKAMTNQTTNTVTDNKVQADITETKPNGVQTIVATTAQSPTNI